MKKSPPQIKLAAHYQFRIVSYESQRGLILFQLTYSLFHHPFLTSWINSLLTLGF